MISALEMRNKSEKAMQNRSAEILNSVLGDMDIVSIENIMLMEATKGNTSVTFESNSTDRNIEDEYIDSYFKIHGNVQMLRSYGYEVDWFRDFTTTASIGHSKTYIIRLNISWKEKEEEND